MREGTVARSYAEALFALGERHGQTDAFAGAMDEVAGLLDGDARIRAFLETPKLGAEVKKRVLRDALGDRVPPLFLNFLLVVVEKRRQRLLRGIARAYHAILDEKLGRVHAQVTLARAPDAATLDEIGTELSRLMGGRSVIPHVQVDPDILGGIVVRYGDRVMDGSLRRRLISLRRQMLGAKLPTGA